LKKCIILANGKPPEKGVINFLYKKNYSTLICADGGANSAKKLGIIPDYIIGDFDSVSKSTLNFFKSKTKLIKLSRQNDTDVEKCLKFVINEKFEDVVLLGVTGNRLDHTFCNLGIVIKFRKKINLRLIAEDSLLIPFSGRVKLKTIRGEIISLYGLDRKTKITSNGLKYPLKNISLPFGEKESTSNVAVGNEINLTIKGGIIFIIRDFNIIKQYGLF
jgi:thiamine pyrophosphokinase